MPGAHSNEAALNKFLAAVNEHPKTLKTLHDVMGTLAHNSRVGVTNYGPQFVGHAEVQKLFRQLFFSFPDITLTEQPGSPRLFSGDKTTIGIQAVLAGSHQGVWFAKGTPYYSPPLSNIAPDATRMMHLDACAVFTFDKEHKIFHIAIYFDRYLMAQHLAPVSCT
jgi:hypothetical protein